MVGGFKKKITQGQSYDLSHLDPFSFELQDGEQTFKVGVDFTCHCFTEALTQAHSPDFHYMHNGEKRAFSIARHSLSLRLPGMVTTLGNKSVYHSEQGNFFFLRDVNASPYLVFFDLFRATS
jgi:hypothetical protein